MNRFSFFYKIYGVILESDIEYPQLMKASEAKEPELRIILPDCPADGWSEDYTNQVFCVNKKKIHFSNQKGSFLVCDGNRIEIQPKKGVPVDELTPFVFGYCMAMVFWQRGKLAIHCSAVKLFGKAYLICGGSGSGKSTLTARLLEQGAKLLADDVAVVDLEADGKAVVFPAFPQQKLCRDAVHRTNLDASELIYIDEDRDKFAVSRTTEFCDSETELGGMIMLNRQSIDEVVLQQLQGKTALYALLDNLFMRPVFSNSCAFPPEDMLKCIQLVQAAPVLKLLRPMTGDTTKEQIHLLVDRIQE